MEDLVTGSAKFISDIQFPQMAEMVVLRSSHPCATIRAIHLNGIEKSNNILATFTAKDIPSHAKFLPASPNVLSVALQPTLAGDKVRYVGEPILVIVAKDKYTAEAAAKRVEILYEPILTAPSPLDQEEPFEEIVLTETYGWGSEIQAASAKASRIIHKRIDIPRKAPFALEPRGVIACASEVESTLYTTTQLPHYIQTNLARLANIQPSKLRVVVPDCIGGGFGSKQLVYSEEILALLLSMRLGRPVRWVESLEERLVSTVQAGQQSCHLKIALDEKSSIVGIQAKLLIDSGAYLRENKAGLNTLHAIGLGYEIPSFSGQVDFHLSNKTPVGVFRGAGHPQAAFITEQIFEHVARVGKVDPIELRKLHLPSSSSNQIGLVDETISPRTFIDFIQESLDYGNIKEQQKLAPPGFCVGIGFCVSVNALAGSAKDPEFASVTLNEKGEITVYSGTVEIGQGIRRTLQNEVARTLLLSPERVNVILGKTEVIKRGWGCYASRGASIAVSAAQLASEKLIKKLRKHASKILDIPAEDLRYCGRKFIVPRQKSEITFEEIICWLKERGGGLPVKAYQIYSPKKETLTYNVSSAVVSVNLLTGVIDLKRYVAYHNHGKILSPKVAENQLVGGIVQGISSALCEQLQYDCKGNLHTTPKTYGIMPARSLPQIELSLIDQPNNTTHSQALGIGEAGTISAFATVFNAVDNALASVGLQTPPPPLTPATIWDVINSDSTM